MPDEPDPIDQLLAAALYVPVGLALELRERFPELAERGRQHLETQISVARTIGRIAVQLGTRQVGAFLQRQLVGTADAPVPPSPAPPSPVPPTRASPTTGPAGSAATGSGAPRSEAPTAGSADPGSLPIAGYDTLAASQVVARLEGLDSVALEAVRTYEAAHRNRKTILGKVAQLQRAT